VEPGAQGREVPGAGEQTARFVERWTQRSGIRIRYADNAPADPVGLPILFVPGLSDVAEEYRETLEFFTPRRCIVVEVRGRGRSDAPASGYRSADHMADLAAVVAEEGLSRFHLMTFSRGTTWALDLAFANPGAVASVSIGDYRAGEVRIEGFVERLWASSFRGKRLSDRIQRHVLDELARESKPRECYEALAALGVPVLVARGTAGGIVDDAVAARYREAIPDVEIVTIPGAAHDLFRPSRTAYPAAVQAFLARRTKE